MRVSLPVACASAVAHLDADAAEPLDATAVRFFDERSPASLRQRAFGDDDDAELGAPAIPIEQPFGDQDVEVERNLGDQDRVRAAGHTRVQRDPARIAAHHLDDHDALWASAVV